MATHSDSPNQEIQDDGDSRKYFAMVPHMADDDLDLYEYRLYGHYLRVCGVKGGTCWERTKTTAKKCGMSAGQVSAKRKSLAEKGFIHVVDGKGTNRTKVTLLDLWEENIHRYKNASVHPMNTPCSPHERIKKNHIEEEKDSGLVEPASASSKNGKENTPMLKGNIDPNQMKASTPKEETGRRAPQTELETLVIGLSTAKALTPAQIQRLNTPVSFTSLEATPEELWASSAEYRTLVREVIMPWATATKTDKRGFVSVGKMLNFVCKPDAFKRKQDGGKPIVSPPALHDITFEPFEEDTFEDDE